MDNIRISQLTGFTLLETLVALSVLAISLGVTYQVFSSALQSSSLADDYAQAAMYADSHIAEISTQIKNLPNVSEGAYNKYYRWKLEVKVLDTSSSNISVEAIKPYQIVLNVYWQGKRGPRSLRAMTFRLANV